MPLRPSPSPPPSPLHYTVRRRYIPRWILLIPLAAAAVGVWHVHRTHGTDTAIIVGGLIAAAVLATLIGQFALPAVGLGPRVRLTIDPGRQMLTLRNAAQMKPYWLPWVRRCRRADIPFDDVLVCAWGMMPVHNTLQIHTANAIYVLYATLRPAPPDPNPRSDPDPGSTPPAQRHAAYPDPERLLAALTKPEHRGLVRRRKTWLRLTGLIQGLSYTLLFAAVFVAAIIALAIWQGNATPPTP
jgi:hypothetical protein